METISGVGLHLQIEAEPGECEALALRFGLEAIARLRTTAGLALAGEGQVRLVVTFDADVVQSCVVTLEPVVIRLSEQFEVVYAPLSEADEKAEVVVDVEAEEPPEPLIAGQIDIGEMVAQHLAMAIDPYPRAPSDDMGDLQASDFNADEDASSEHPFAQLAQLRQDG